MRSAISARGGPKTGPLFFFEVWPVAGWPYICRSPGVRAQLRGWLALAESRSIQAFSFRLNGRIDVWRVLVGRHGRELSRRDCL